MVDYHKLVNDFLMKSFVEDYAYNKRFVEKFNNDLQKLGVDYKYTYDEFCIELLDRTLFVIDEVRNSLTVKKLKVAFYEIIDRIVDEMKSCKVTGDTSYISLIEEHKAAALYRQAELS